MATRVKKEVELGFVEIPEDLQLLTSAHRPSKVGGKPAWLDQVHPPSPDDLACSSCGKQLTFLLQIYAPFPVDEAKPDGDEQPRTVFVFMCRDPSCHSKGASKCFKVFRCQQLAEENPSVINDVDESLVDKNLSSQLGELSLDATKEGTIASRTSTISSSSNSPNGDQICLSQDSLEEPTSLFDSSQNGGTHVYPLTQSHTSSPPLCIVCGCSGQKRCGKCTMAHYCSKEHQIHDWRSGHKNVCGELSSGKMTIGDLKYAPSKGVVLPEYEIVTELEPDLTLIGNGNPERSEEDRMADYRKFINSGKCVDSGKGGASGLSPKDLKDAAMSEHSTDKQFRTFKKRVVIEPEQVIRYQRDGQPLLVSVKGAPGANDIPNCSCGAQRKFEFQIMPQLLYYLKLDSVSGPSIDWGTLIIYTCSSGSCSTVGRGYQQEVIWRQNFT